jgi:hypothetical protein
MAMARCGLGFICFRIGSVSDSEESIPMSDNFPSKGCMLSLDQAKLEKRCRVCGQKMDKKGEAFQFTAEESAHNNCLEDVDTVDWET